MKRFWYVLIFSAFLLTGFLFCTPKVQYQPHHGTYISLSPAITEIIYALKLEKSLVAVSSFCNYPQEALKKEKVGTAFVINKEKIVTLKPEFVFALDSQKPLVSDLASYGIKVVYLSFKTVENLMASIVLVGKTLHQEQQALKMTEKLKKEMHRQPVLKETRTLFVVQADPLIITGRDSFITDIINRAGYVCVSSAIKGSYPVVSYEYLFVAKPNLIIVPDHHAKEILSQHYKAHYVVLNPEQNAIFTRPGPRIIALYRFLTLYHF